jgi:RNA polymerase sigma-70 factor (ECF subfamily)
MTEHPDSQAIRAVRTGDIERFRELIERYERQVYAIAWARLGDATLAEDAVQESFIRAFRLLGWLKHPERFAGWITRIARAVAINLGLRNRRELRRRERWSIDQAHCPAEGGSPTPDPDEPAVSPDALRTALSDLPRRHRECLVLFYLEGKSISDAACALGISDGAFKVRLHRSRQALRGRLEQHLETSLGRLSPRRSLTPSIMASIAFKAAATDPTGSSHNLLALASLGLAKLIPFPLLFLLLPVATLGVSLGAGAWATRAEQKNYLEAASFHRELYDQERFRLQDRAALLALAAVVAILFANLYPDFLTYALLGLPLLIVPELLSAWREFALSRQLSSSLISGIFTTPLILAMGLGLIWNLPQQFLGLLWGIHFLGWVLFPAARRVRFDDNLFLRARLNLLPAGGDHETDPAPGMASTPATRDFPRFLAREGLCSISRGVQGGLQLKLRPILSSGWDAVGCWFWKADSTITLRENGTVEAHLGSRDQTHFARLNLGSTLDHESQERTLATAVRRAWCAHERGNMSEARHRLGHVPQEQLFAADPNRTGHVRVRRWVGVLGLFYAALMIAAPYLPGNRTEQAKARAAQFEAISLSLAEARTRFNQLETQGNPQSRHRWDYLLSALGGSHVLPPFDWLGPEARGFLRNHGSPPPKDILQHPTLLLSRFEDWQTLKAFCFDWEELPGLALLREPRPRLRAALAATSASERARLLTPEVVRVTHADHSILRLEPLRWKIAALRKLDLLDVFDTAPLVKLLKAHQILSHQPMPEGRDPLLDQDLWNGLIATAGLEPITETYLALAILQDLNAVQFLDRMACAHGLLRLHLGEGFLDAQHLSHQPFTRKLSGDRPKTSPYVPGTAPTTYAARESLRILDALDRIPDLAAWKFRIPTRPAAQPPNPSPWNTAWDEVEAVLLREPANPSHPSW